MEASQVDDRNTDISGASQLPEITKCFILGFNFVNYILPKNIKNMQIKVQMNRINCSFVYFFPLGNQFIYKTSRNHLTVIIVTTFKILSHTFVFLNPLKRENCVITQYCQWLSHVITMTITIDLYVTRFDIELKDSSNGMQTKRTVVVTRKVAMSRFTYSSRVPTVNNTDAFE